MITFNWTIENLYTQTIENKENYVVNALYKVTATDDTETSVSEGFFRFDTSSSSTFIPYAELTEATVIGWIKDSLGQDGVNSIEVALQAQIEAKKNPPVSPTITPLPWN